MRSLSERIRTFIFSKNTGAFPANTPFDFIKTKKGILRELSMSKESGSFVGIYSDAFGAGMFLARVEAIELSHREEFIVFHQYDISGQKLPKSRIRLKEISMICPFYKDQSVRTQV